MTKQRTTHTLLAVVAVLLGLHLALRLSPREAAAQGGPPVQITHMAASSDSRTAIRAHLFRTWSDGIIEQNIQFSTGGPTDLWTGWEVVPEEAQGQPVPPSEEEPHVVVERHVVAWEFTHLRQPRHGSAPLQIPVIMRQWSDGVIEVAIWGASIPAGQDISCGANPFAHTHTQPCLSEWVVLEEFTP